MDPKYNRFGSQFIYLSYTGITYMVRTCGTVGGQTVGWGDVDH